MPSSSAVQRFKSRLDKILGGALVVLMTVAVLNVLWQVVTRFILGDPSSFTEELARYLLIWIGVLGAGYAVGQRAHLALELLPERLEGRSLQLLERLIFGCVAAFALLVMVGGGIRLVYLQFMLGQTSPTLGWPLGAVYTVVPLSGVIMLVYTVLQIMEPPTEPASPQSHDVGSA